MKRSEFIVRSVCWRCTCRYLYGFLSSAEPSHCAWLLGIMCTMSKTERKYTSDSTTRKSCNTNAKATQRRNTTKTEVSDNGCLQ